MMEQQGTELIHVLISLSVLLFAAKLFAELFNKIRLPSVLGELLAGIIIGPFALGSIPIFDGKPYDRYVKVLKYLVLSLFAYVITAVIVGGNISQILLTIIPSITFSSEYVVMFVAVIGTTISPYLLFWQTSEEAEEDVTKHRIKEIGKGKPKVSPKEIMLMKEDIGIGMFFSQFIMWSIIITSAGSLYFAGITDIQTADQAASALEPLVTSFPNSGQIAKLIFAFGIIGTGLLAIPILSASSAFALSDTFGWKEGLEKKFSQAKSFYAVIAASTLIGVWITFSHF